MSILELVKKTPDSENYKLLKNISLARQFFWTSLIGNKKFANTPIKIYNIACEKCNKIIFDGSECVCNSDTPKLEAGRGRKKCKNCPTYTGPRSANCPTCGYNFKTGEIQAVIRKKDTPKVKVKKRKKAVEVPFVSIDSLSILIENDKIEENILSFKKPELYCELSEDVRSALDAYHQWRNEMIETNMKLVCSIASQKAQTLKSKKSLDFLSVEDLIQVGYIGLKKAVTHYDINYQQDNGNHIAFSTYATWWIRKEIHDEVIKKDKDIMVPFHIVNKFKNFRNWYNAYLETNGSEPTKEELMEGLKLKDSDIEGLLMLKDMRHHKMISVEETLDKYRNDYSEDSKVGRMDLSVLMKLSHEEEYEFDILKHVDSLEFTKPTYKFAFKDYFGLNDDRKPLTMDELEEKYGVTKQTINNQINKQLVVLREKLKEDENLIN